MVLSNENDTRLTDPFLTFPSGLLYHSTLRGVAILALAFGVPCSAEIAPTSAVLVAVGGSVSAHQTGAP